MYRRFVELLEKTGETTAQVSRATEIRESVFSNWKSRKGGNGGISVRNLYKIAKHFGVSIEYFLADKVSE